MMVERTRQFTNKDPGSGADVERELSILTNAHNDHDQGRKGWNRLEVTDGSDKRMGVAVLVAGTVTVSNTTVTANTRIFLSTSTAGGTVGHPYVSARVASTSFTITSTNAADTSTIAWLLVEPK